VIRANRIELAELLAKEQAKVAGLAQVEIDFTAEYFDYYAGWARIYEAGEIISSDVSVRAEINISQHPRVDPYAIDATSARWRDGAGPSRAT
jgi:acyl-CoA reductase-like NAD-dependent aldehyde dehydrogenase